MFLRPLGGGGRGCAEGRPSGLQKDPIPGGFRDTRLTQWIASDILGVPNLRRRAQELYGYIYHRLRGTMGRKPYLLELKPYAKYTFMVYSILVNLFMGYYFVYIIPSFVYHFVMSFPSEIEKIVILLSNNMAPPFSLLRNICMQLLFLILILVMIYRIVSPLFSKCKK